MKKEKTSRFKNNLDEMQEQKLLHIEHNGYWLAFWGLLISMIVQLLMYEAPNERYVAGEYIVFMCLCIYMVFGCIKNGIWDRWLKPTMKNNLIASVIAGVLLGIFGFVMSYRRYHMTGGAAATGIVYMFMVFGAVFAGLTISMLIYNKRNDKLENGEAENEDTCIESIKGKSADTDNAESNDLTNK